MIIVLELIRYSVSFLLYGYLCKTSTIDNLLSPPLKRLDYEFRVHERKQECLFQGHEQCLFLFWHVPRTPLSFQGNTSWNEVRVHYSRWHLCSYIYRFTWCYPFRVQNGQIEINIFILYRIKIHFLIDERCFE